MKFIRLSESENQPTAWLRNDPFGGRFCLFDDNGELLSRYEAKDVQKAKLEAIEFCKSKGLRLFDETETPPKPMTQLADSTKNQQEPFGAWKLELQKKIVAAIQQAQRDGIVSMSADNLRMVVRPPTSGGPSGTNVQYYYKNQWFPEALAAVAKLSPAYRQFIEGDPNRIASVKRHKKRPKSHVGKMEGAYNGKDWSKKLDTQLTPVHRYVLEMDFPVLLKKSL